MLKPLRMIALFSTLSAGCGFHLGSSTLATTPIATWRSHIDAADDFAESFATYVSLRDFDLQYTFATAGRATHDVAQKLKSERFAAKANYIANLLAKPDLVIPGQ